MVDRDKGDPRNLMGVILNRKEHDLYRVAVCAGVLIGRYSRIQFDLCALRLYSINNVSTNKEIEL